MPDLATRVREMRTLQTAYFKTRDPCILKDAKEAERCLDALLAEQEGNLFTAPEDDLLTAAKSVLQAMEDLFNLGAYDADEHPLQDACFDKLEDVVKKRDPEWRLK